MKKLREIIPEDFKPTGRFKIRKPTQSVTPTTSPISKPPSKIASGGGVKNKKGGIFSALRFRKPSFNKITGISSIKQKFNKVTGINTINRLKPSRIMQRLKQKVGIYGNKTLTRLRSGIFKTPFGLGRGKSERKEIKLGKLRPTREKLAVQRKRPLKTKPVNNPT
jgi:nucleotidyltransferase/DNA polymerase involved in DNA repair